MSAPQVLGIIIAGLLTLFVFSFLFKDNPLYKFAEHLYVGVSAGYVMVIDIKNVLIPNLFDNLKAGVDLLGKGGAFPWKEFSYLLPALLGLMLLMRLLPKGGWISRWPLAFLVGLSAGLSIVYSMQAQIIEQIQATLVPLWVGGDLEKTLFNWTLVLGVSCGLLYFYFSKEHRGKVFGTVSKIGIAFLMITFGAGFGYTVMARISLLIGRVLFFRDEFYPALMQIFHLK